MFRPSILVPFVLSALLLGGCGGGEPSGDAGSSDSRQAARSAKERDAGEPAVARDPQQSAEALEALGDGTGIPTAQQEQAAIDAMLRENAGDPRVVFDREAQTAFRKLRSEQQICAMNRSEDARNQCNANARQAFDAAKADAARRRDEAMASAPAR